MMNLEQYLYHLERSHLYVSVDDTKQAKKECLEAVKILNTIAKESKDFPHLKTLSQFTINYYDTIGKEPKSVSDKLTWISSKITPDNFFPPIIDFDSGVNSNHGMFVDTSSAFDDPDKVLRQLPKEETEYEPRDVLNWNNNLNDLTNLYQDILPNCSFVSSFLAIVDNNIPIIEIISPHAKSSKYKVILRFNGTARSVTIDSRLPTLPNKRNLIIKSSTDPDLYWPALIEKAYLKIMGKGYVFSGSNMANDAYLLSGWLPQIIKIVNGKLPNSIAELWELKSQGKVILGIGTGSLSKKLSSQLHLITEHDYMIEKYNKEDRSIVVKNPWLDQKTQRLINIKDFTYFRFLYVNWKPEAITCQQNFLYDVKPYSFNQPQFTITNIEESWLLLERHLPEAQQWMDINIFDTEHKVISPTQYPKHLSVETNNRLQLVKLKPGIFTIVISSNKPGKFTLTSFGGKFTKLKYKHQHFETVDGDWNCQTNGGNWAMSTYIDNPQYDVVVTEPTDLVVGMYGTGQINFHVFHSDKKLGQRLRKFDKTKLENYQNYNLSFQLQKYRLSPGIYKLVASEYERGQGDFQLVFNSNNPVAVTKIPQSLGLFTSKTSYNWENTNRYKFYFETTNYNSQISFRINYFSDDSQDYELQNNYRPAIRASIFHSRTKQPIQINEDFDDCLYGIYVDELLHEPDEYILLIERFEIGYGRCSVEIGCNYKVLVKAG
ncbi:Calpain-like protease palB/RIM13 [Candida viswanathii]|uniref:Cysteine protease RIM13 n=1 Tax=Candida viswanathii TaxID=5486 RepID=A0A367YGD3_9ASCO|nr:Calpain-like protease palB/RIM13 [Candida viswanathii]